MEQSHSWEADSRSDCQESPPHPYGTRRFITVFCTSGLHVVAKRTVCASGGNRTLL